MIFAAQKPTEINIGDIIAGSARKKVQLFIKSAAVVSKIRTVSVLR